MKYFLGIDTSAYTTSAAIAGLDGSLRQVKRLLPVPPGERGLRQSDALFAHTKALPQVLEELYQGFDGEIAGVGVSSRPRDVEGSYMPCFLAGISAARASALASGAGYCEFSHQAGHIMAALHSAQPSLPEGAEFLAFHVSGGTHELLRVTHTGDTSKPFEVSIICATGDISGGQAIDRVGVALGCPFPSGQAMEEMALQSEKSFKIKPSVDAHGQCALSGLENQAMAMVGRGERPCDIAKYTLDYVGATVAEMSAHGLRHYPGLPVVFAGGVMSNLSLREELARRFDGRFALPALSSDNAAGTALLALRRLR